MKSGGRAQFDNDYSLANELAMEQQGDVVTSHAHDVAEKGEMTMAWQTPIYRVS